jgi:hypothetical protein
MIKKPPEEEEEEQRDRRRKGNRLTGLILHQPVGRKRRLLIFL